MFIYLLQNIFMLGFFLLRLLGLAFCCGLNVCLMPILLVVTRTDLSASTLSPDDLNKLKDDLDLLHASVTERISTLIQENNTLSNWSEANKRDKALVSCETYSSQTLPHKP